MWELNYNIHDLLTVKICSVGKKDLTANLRYSYFAKSGCVDEPDIVLNIGPFKSSNDGAEIIAHRYFVKENYFYCKETGNGAKWEIEIFGFEKGNTVINFFGRYHGIRGILFPSFMAQEFLLPIIEHKLARKNYFLMHGGAACKNNMGFVLKGRPGVWKTTLLMDFLRTDKYQFLGDDRVILKEDGSVLSFPTSLFLFSYTLINSRTEERDISDNLKLLFHVIVENTGKFLFNPIASCNHINKILFVSRETNQNIKIKSISPQEGLQKLIINNMAEYVESTKKSPIGQYYNYVQVYSLIFPNNDLLNHYHRMCDGLKKIVTEIPMHEIILPYRYDQTTLDTLIKQIY